MNIGDFLSALFAIFSNQDLLFQIVLLIFIGFYSIFALIVTVQIRILNNVVTQIMVAPIFRALSYIHVLFAITLVLITALLLF